MQWKGDYVLLEILSQWEHYPRMPSLPNFDLCTCKVWSCYVQGFRRKCICKKYMIKPWPYVKVTWSIALYIMWPVYLQNLKLLWPMVKEMHYQEITRGSWPQGQGGQGHTKCFLVPLTSCDLCTSKVWCCYILWLRRRCIYKKIHYLTLALGSRSHKMLPSTLDIMWPMHQQSLILLHPTVK